MAKTRQTSKRSEGSSEKEMPSEIRGLRMTRQRWALYQQLMHDRDHPTAIDLFTRLREQIPNISLGTVYTCLEAMTKHGIIKQVNFDRESSRYCPNLKEHGHFHDEATGTIRDIAFREGVNLHDLLELPEGTHISEVEITLRGELPA